MQTLNGFQPPLFLKNAHVQTVLASSRLRTLGTNTMRGVARKEIIETAGGIKLLGYHSVQKVGPPKGLAILLHGWEGSTDSTYLLRTGRNLYANGYDIFRLNFRDIMGVKTIQALTDALLEKYSDFSAAQDYFDAYSVMGPAIADIHTPTTIVTAQDDPIIPIKDFYDLELNKHIRLVIHPYGGHNGFITGFKLKSWYENTVIRLFDQICAYMENYNGRRQND